MAVFNCSPSELKKIIISTQISDLPTGELTVTDSLKIKGVQGVSVSVDGDEILFGVDGDSFPDGIGGSSLPEITESDAGKVLTANADGTAGWKEPTGGTEILTFASVEEMNASTVPDGTIALVPDEETSELPEITAEHEGKVLGVSNGELAFMDMPEAESSLPEITEDDDGKVLTASGGAWVAQTPSGGGLPVIEFTNGIYDGEQNPLTEQEAEAIFQMAKANTPFVGKFDSSRGTQSLIFNIEDVSLNENDLRDCVIKYSATLFDPFWNERPMLWLFRLIIEYSEFYSICNVFEFQAEQLE